MMLGGDTWPAVQPIANKSGMLVSTLLPSDLSPDTPTLIAPCEVHPIYNVTGVWWLADNMPDLKSAVICAQDDALGRPSVATYLAAFEAHGIEVRDTVFFDLSTTDFAPVMTKMLSSNPDVLCLDTAYADFVHPALRAGVPAGVQGEDHLLHRGLLREDHREDLEGVHGRLHLPVPGLRRPGAQTSRRSTSRSRTSSTPSTASAGPGSGARCPGSTPPSWTSGYRAPSGSAAWSPGTCCPA